MHACVSEGPLCMRSPSSPVPVPRETAGLKGRAGEEDPYRHVLDG
jgi:hypothetical protein